MSQTHLQQQRRENRPWILPEATIQEVPPRKIPFPYLRSWFVGLLALLLLPVSLILILVGDEMANRTEPDWLPIEATVVSVLDRGIGYAWEYKGIQYSDQTLFELHNFFEPNRNGSLYAKISVCDLLVPFSFVLPRETGREFSLWIDPQNPTASQCVPVDNNSGETMSALGWVLLIVSGWVLIRRFHQAALQTRTR